MESALPRSPIPSCLFCTEAYLRLDGWGIVQHPVLAPELSNIGVFHQMHCLVSTCPTARQDLRCLTGFPDSK